MYFINYLFIIKNRKTQRRITKEHYSRILFRKKNNRKKDKKILEELLLSHPLIFNMSNES